MHKKNPLRFLFVVFFIVVSCSKDNDNKAAELIGSWDLTTWTIHIPMDLNQDGEFNTNLLAESDCVNNESLIFDSNGTFSSNLSFNPTVIVSIVSESTDNYNFAVQCETEGSIGLAGAYTLDENSVTLLGKTAIIEGNTLSIIFENEIDIYNEAHTEVIATTDLTLIYTKK